MELDLLKEIISFKAVEANRRSNSPRHYLGASGVGNPCQRAVWYQYRWAVDRDMTAKSVFAIEDGHAQEAVMRQRMSVAGFIFSSDPQKLAVKYGMLAGNLDGWIEAGPEVKGLSYPCVWEHKSTNEKKYKELEKKKSLKEWDQTYFGQAQIYMYLSGASQHFLSCSLPGGRDFQFLITDLDASFAKKLIDETIEKVVNDEPPVRNESFACNWCDFAPICLEAQTDKLAINCRTCMFVNNGEQTDCAKKDIRLDKETERKGCNHHLFNFHLVKDEQVDALEAEDGSGLVAIKYKNVGTNFQGKGFKND